MRPTHSRCDGRLAFTLIELLVVIAIITVLVALAAAGIMGAFGAGTQAKVKVEIDQLAAAVNLAKTDLGFDYLPSKLVLVESGSYNMSDPDQSRTARFLQTAFGKHVLDGPIDWNQNGKMDPAPIVLYADQSMVFVLGGVPDWGNRDEQTNSCLGFSTDPRNPMKRPLSPGETRKGPYFDFKTTQLRLPRIQPDRDDPKIPLQQKRPLNGFFVYLDGWKTNQPYLYFSSKGKNDYSNTDAIPSPAEVLLGYTNYNVRPYQETGARFTNPNSFQIISAGKNGVFGPGGPWNPATGIPNNTPGGDDQANFGGAILASGN